MQAFWEGKTWLSFFTQIRVKLCNEYYYMAGKEGCHASKAWISFFCAILWNYKDDMLKTTVIKLRFYIDFKSVTCPHMSTQFCDFRFLLNICSIISIHIWSSLFLRRVAVCEDWTGFGCVTVVKAQSLLWNLGLTVHGCSHWSIDSRQALTVTRLKIK